jgi:hypothetical protein
VITATFSLCKLVLRVYNKCRERVEFDAMNPHTNIASRLLPNDLAPLSAVVLVPRGIGSGIPRSVKGKETGL